MVLRRWQKVLHGLGKVSDGPENVSYELKKETGGLGKVSDGLGKV